jgi:hypothetical protein
MSVHQLQSQVGLYPGPDHAEPKGFLPANLLTSNGSSNPTYLSPEQSAGQLGQMVYLRGPMFFDTDISLVKSIPITERVRFNIFAEFINALNHPNWTAIDNFSSGTKNPGQYANISSSTFSALSSTPSTESHLVTLNSGCKCRSRRVERL